MKRDGLAPMKVPETLPLWMELLPSRTSVEVTVSGDTPAIESLARGEEVPTPRRLAVLFQNRFTLFCEITPPVPANGMEPAVKLPTVRLVVVVLMRVKNDPEALVKFKVGNVP